MVLGVTGGIATGKSSVADMFGELGAVVVSADELARQAVAPGTDALHSLVDRFGREILAGDGSLDRAALAAVVFNDDAARAELNRITHPAIARLAEQRLAGLRGEGHALIVYEAPLLFEAGAEARVDRVLVVTAAPALQLQRLMARDDIGRDEALAKIAAQMPLPDKVARADYVIDNSGSMAETKAEVELLFKDLAGVNGR